MSFLAHDKYIVLDFETTGNQIKEGDQIIQIGLCLIEEGQIVDRFSTFVQPTIDIPPFIENLTGINNEQVKNAPFIEDVLPELLKRLDQATLVAHNVVFDLSFLQHILKENGYLPFTGLTIDTVELARILFPDRGSYKLHQLALDLEMEHEHPHQADSDALATAQLFLNLCEKLYSLPLVTLQRMLPLSRSLQSDIEILLRRIEGEKLLHLHKQNDQNKPIEIYRHIALRTADTEQDKRLSAINKRVEILPVEMNIDVERIISSVMPDYESRLGQQQFVQAITDAFQAKEHGLFEVGTGTGKTFAYLLAALFWSKVSGEKVVISTYTIQLQEQIKEKELTMLKEALPFSFQTALLKGRNHYLCLRKFEQSLFNPGEKNYDSDLTKMQFLVWLNETESGDIEELNLPSGGREFWDKVQSDTASCLHDKCPWHSRCFYYRAKRKADQADLIVTNHSLMLADLKYNHIIPRYRYLIVDEAHHLDRVAIDQYGKNIKYASIHFLLQRLIAIEKLNLSQQLIQSFELLLEGENYIKRIEELFFLLSELKGEIDTLFTRVYSYAEEKLKGYTEGNVKKVRFEHHHEHGEAWMGLLQCTEVVSSQSRHIFSLQRELLIELDELDEQLSHEQRSSLTDWNSTLNRLEEYLSVVKELLLEANPDEYVYWIEYEQKGTRHSSALFQMPLGVASPLQENLFDQKESVILTSATLQVNGSYTYYMEQLGLQVNRVKLETIPSPFNYEQQAKLLILEDVAKIGEVSDEQFAAEIAQSIFEIAKVSNGRMLVLFTSYHLLRLSHQWLKQPLQEFGIAIFAQGIDSGSRGKLTKNFQNHENAILLGTNSFWEGIDIPGEDLSCLVIVKLPFTPPNTPFYEAKAERLKKEGKNPFKDFALPQAVIRFKQGFGRLIRRNTDKGVVIVLDRRIIEARYGASFIRSLPQIKVQRVNNKDLGKEIKHWLG